ncbi:hypothetical protein TKWG_24305 [Advenella kashmirensis WT001]|uniref:Uncharacterized protein n=1 Tax=Advenella kashmirensis (strain DSM 17095 / LMG 22695 / WT001) TaxID=1036672 RepID=I3UHD8_ADVKW|nr:type II toxin-antitoxin system RelE/ParE family toxin [Advenella kashmirensis]AFK64426.1 hypothetical protein TKWG_24305 [Advenella kashmirensis WT001]
MVFAPSLQYRIAERAFFVYGFSKNNRDNIDDDEEAAFKKAAGYVLGLSDSDLAELIDQKQFTEVHDHDKETPK